MAVRLKNTWMDKPATVPEILRYRKVAGYTVREDIHNWWRRTAVWWVLRLIPRGVKYYVVVQVACKGEMGNPGEVTAHTMLKRYETKAV